MLCGYEPFYGDTETQLMESNRIVNYAFHSPEWDHINYYAKDFIKKCFHQRWILDGSVNECDNDDSFDDKYDNDDGDRYDDGDDDNEY